jgi:hypothetical protein
MAALEESLASVRGEELAGAEDGANGKKATKPSTSRSKSSGSKSKSTSKSKSKSSSKKSGSGGRRKTAAKSRS